MFAYFHSEGTIPYSSDKLKNFASGVLICSTISLSSFGGIPSTWHSYFLFETYIQHLNMCELIINLMHRDRPRRHVDSTTHSKPMAMSCTVAQIVSETETEL